MANTQVAGGDTILAAKSNEITVGTTAPSSPTTGWVWIDTSVTPKALKIWSGAAWIPTDPHVEAKNSGGGSSIESVTFTTAYAGTPVVVSTMVYTEAGEVVVNSRSTTGATVEGFDIGASAISTVKMVIAREAT